MELPARRRRSLACLIVFAAAIGLSFAGAQTAAPGARLISRGDAVADLDALFAAIERIHPDPYFIRPREAVIQERRQLAANLPETVRRNEWWLQVAPIVASLEDGHTEAPPPIAFIDQFVAVSGAKGGTADILRRIHVFPGGSVTVDPNRHLVVTSAGLGEGVNRGDRIVSINGQDADQLVSEWIRATSGDSDANRAASIITRMTDLLAVRAIASPYRLTVAGADGVQRTVSIDGPTMQSMVDARKNIPDSFSYRTLERRVGYMDFYSMAGDFGSYKKSLATMFRQAAADGIATLIVDVRNNMGGYSQFGDELLRYLTRTAYRSWSRLEVKRSEELRAQIPIPPPFRWAPLKYIFTDTRQIYAGPTGTFGVWTKAEPTTPDKREPFFAGAVCVLTGARTFSAAVSLADAVKTYRLATLVGEETGGRANMTMEPVIHTLPRSALAVSIAAGRSIRANGDRNDLGGVIPDIVVRTTTADIRDGRDPVLERAKDCPRLE